MKLQSCTCFTFISIIKGGPFRLKFFLFFLGFQLARLLVYMISTRQVLEDRTYILSYIANEQKGQEILKILINTSPEYVSTVCVKKLKHPITKLKDN